MSECLQLDINQDDQLNIEELIPYFFEGDTSECG